MLFFGIAHNAAIRVSGKVEVSSEDLTEQESASQFTDTIWGRIQFLRALGRKASIPHYLSARGLPQVLAMWASPMQKLDSSQPGR